LEVVLITITLSDGFLVRLDGRRQMREKKGTVDDCNKIWPTREQVIVRPELFSADKFNFSKVHASERIIPLLKLRTNGIDSQQHTSSPSPSPSPSPSSSPSPSPSPSSSTDVDVEFGDYQVVTNKYPLAFRHVLLVASEIRPQIIRRADVYAAIDFVTNYTNELFVFFSSWSAGATVNHFHMQLYPSADIPIFALPSQAKASDRGSSSSSDNNKAQRTIRDYPAANTVYEMQAAGIDSIEQACNDIEQCIEHNRPHNLLITKTRIYLFVRARDPLVREQARELYGQLPACLEFAGTFNAYDAAKYASLDGERMRQIMSMCTEEL
jgi:hypothetical protein